MSNTEIVDKNLPNGRPSTTHSESRQDSAPLHTPGPWTIDRTYHSLIKADGRVIASADCCNRGGDGFDTMLKLENEANARLIAAAPQLLEACKLAARELQAMHGYHHPTCEGGCPFDEANKRARVAISKAEGKDVQSR